MLNKTLSWKLISSRNLVSPTQTAFHPFGIFIFCRGFHFLGEYEVAFFTAIIQELHIKIFITTVRYICSFMCLHSHTCEIKKKKAVDWVICNGIDTSDKCSKYTCVHGRYPCTLQVRSSFARAVGGGAGETSGPAEAIAIAVYRPANPSYFERIWNFILRCIDAGCIGLPGAARLFHEMTVWFIADGPNLRDVFIICEREMSCFIISDKIGMSYTRKPP